MDFKTRFQGKMTRISKDGGIEDMVRTTSNPINRVDKVTIRSLQQPTNPADTSAASDNASQGPKISYGSGAQVQSPYQSFQNSQQQFSANAGESSHQGFSGSIGRGSGAPQPGGIYTAQKSSYGQSHQASPGGISQGAKFGPGPLPPQQFNSSRHDQSFVSGGDARQDGTVYSAKTSFYSNMQQSAARQNQQVQQPVMSPSQHRQTLGSEGGSFVAGDQVYVPPQSRQFTSGGFSNFQRPIPMMGPTSSQPSHLQKTQYGQGSGASQNPGSSIAMRLMQQKHAREQNTTNNALVTSGDFNNSEINLYAPNPFGGLQAPVAGSSGESDQTYNLGARTEYGGLQPGVGVSPHQTKASFIAVQDGGPSAQGITRTKSHNENSGQPGRTSQQLRQSMEEGRKRNLVNVSQHIMMSPNQQKALSEAKQIGVGSRPPSHPGPSNKTNYGTVKATPLPPKPESSKQRQNSSAARGQDQAHTKNMQIKQQNIIHQQQSSQRQQPNIRQTKHQQRSNSISGTGPQRNIQHNNISSREGAGNGGYNSQDESLFAQYGNDDELRPAVQEISAAQVPAFNARAAAQKPPQFQNNEAIQMQLNMMQQQMLLLQQQSQMQIMSGNTGNLASITAQMQQLQQMQMNLQNQIGQAPPSTGLSQPGFGTDDNSFLHEDLPNLADKILLDAENAQPAKYAPGVKSQSRDQMKRQSSQGGISANNSGANRSQYQPYKMNDYRQKKNQMQNQRMGGLGANIGGEQWEKAQLKKQAAREYAEQVRLQTQANPLPRKVKAVPARELTAREKALQFAKNVPKPKVQVAPRTATIEEARADGGEGIDFDYGQNEPYGEVGETGTQGLHNQIDQINELDAKHDYYADELEKIKAMLQ